MKVKKQKKKNEEGPLENISSRQEVQPGLKIKFDICQDKIACFVGEKKYSKKKAPKISSSLRKTKSSLPKCSPKSHEPRRKA
jgi:hypothetical protein